MSNEVVYGANPEQKLSVPMSEMTRLSVEERRAILLPEMYPKMSADVAGQQVVDANRLALDANTIWRAVVKKGVKLTDRVTAPLNSFAHDFGFLDTEIPEPGADVERMIRVVEDAGEAIIDCTDWTTSALKGTMRSVRLHRVSRPFGLSSYSFSHGDDLETYAGAAVDSVLKTAFKYVMSRIAEADAETVAIPGGVDGFDARYVVRKLAKLFPGLGRPDSLLINPELYTQLLPVSEQDLQIRPGSHGVREIFETVFIEGLHKTGGVEDGVGLLGMRTGLVVGGGTPKLSEMGFSSIAIRDLGTINGIPMLLKMTQNGGKEIINASAESMIGATVLDPTRLKVLTLGEAAGAASSAGAAAGTPAGES